MAESSGVALEALIATAAEGIANGTAEHLRSLDEAGSPLYVTDAQGIITYYNKACIDFAGRMPSVGKDRWCVTWKLYTPEGAFLPHEECPMAVAVKERRYVRGVTALAERPDGTRRAFLPYPTPVLERPSGKLLAAVNAFEDLTPAEHHARLQEQALRHHRLARATSDDRTRQTLLELAREYERMALAVAPDRPAD